MGSICKAAHFSFRHSSLLADWRIFLFFLPRTSRRWLIFFYFQSFTLKWTFHLHCAAAEHPVFHDSKGEKNKNKKNSGTLLAFYFLCNLRQVAFRRVREFSGRTERWARWQSSPPRSRFSCQRARQRRGIGVFCVHCVHMAPDKGSCACVIEELIDHIWGRKKKKEKTLSCCCCCCSKFTKKANFTAQFLTH